MSVSRRASFAAGIAAARRNQRNTSQPSRGGRRFQAPPAQPTAPPSIINSGWGSEDTPDNDSTIITDTGATVTTNDDQGSINTVRMASAASLKEQDSITVITEGGGSGPGLGNSNNPALYDRTSLEKGDSGSLTMAQGMPMKLDGGWGDLAANLPTAVNAASNAGPKPKISHEVHPFTRESLEKINLRTSNLIRDYGFLPRRAPTILDGGQLPAKYEPFPDDLLGKPVEEVDPYVYDKTFCVVSRRFKKHFVQRYSATRSIFVFAPWNKFRCFCVYLSSNQYFDYVVMLTILVNCIFLAKQHPVEEAEYIFLVIYSIESVVKIIAKGFILNGYTYLRNPWNWLDFTVILSGYLTSFIEMGNLAGLRTFRVLRALKTVAILPSLKTIINALLNAVKQLAEVMTLTIFCLMVFALFALQVYMGQLRNKCVRDFANPSLTSTTDLYTIHSFDPSYDGDEIPGDRIPDAMGVYPSRNWTEWVLNKRNWYFNPESGTPELCGNASGARPCPGGYLCLPHVGDNPNFGFTSFDNLLWSMLTTFQLITLDYWENVYNMIVATGGPMSVIFFTIVVFFGSFYLINLMLAVVAMSYEEEAEANEKEQQREAEELKQMQNTYETKEEECTIKTNSQPEPPVTDPMTNRLMYSSGAIGGSNLDMCGNCSNNSREALHKKSSAEGLNGEKVRSKKKDSPPKSSSKSKQGSNRKKAGGSDGDIENGGDLEESDVEYDENVEGARKPKRARHQSHRGRQSASNRSGAPNPDQYSLSNYSSDGNYSNKSSLNDSGVVGDQELDNVSVKDKQLQLYQQQESLDNPNKLAAGEIINCENTKNGNGRNSGDPLVITIDDPFPNDRNWLFCRKCCIGCCYRIWLRFQDCLLLLVTDMLFDTTVTLCIILNTAFLAVEHHGMSEDLKHVLEIGNKVFTTFFTAEACLKLLACSKSYFDSGWNIFDLVIVIASLVDLSVENINGISVLRGMRLMRVLKLAQSWTTMKVLLSIIISTLGALGNLTFLLIIVIYIFAVLGMQLFAKTYTEENFAPDRVPRWNFTDFFHSFMMIFRILCGEWIEPLWDCMRAESKVGVAESCLLIFLPALMVGNFMVLNLFLALLLNSFNSEELKSRKEEVKGEQSGSTKFFSKKLKTLQAKFRKKKDKQDGDGSLEESGKKFSSNGSLVSQANGVSKPGIANPAKGQSKSLTFEDGVEAGTAAAEASEEEKNKKTPEACCPALIHKYMPWIFCFRGTCLGRCWDMWRQVIFDFVDNPFFEWTILLLIFASSLSLCFEDINLQDNEELMLILKIVNMVFAVLFTIEMLLKWVAFGLWRYFTSAWTCLDFVIVCVSILSLAIEGSANLTALRSLRTLRALRPLRAISRWQGMKIVVNALMYAIPSIFNVLLVCLVFWLIFSIMGVQFFGGRFYRCIDEMGERLPIDIVNDKWDCANLNLTWVNAKITFDHVGHAYLALFQVATFEGWMEVMADAVDAREVDQQPDWEASLYNYFFFIIFIVCGSFFTLNLFIGVIIDNFNALKKKYEGGVLEMFLTESQKNYYTAMKKLGTKKPQKVIQRPTNEFHALFYDISNSRRFEIAIFILIFLNMVTMGIEHYNQSRAFTFTLEISNALFTTIFSLECVVKIIGLRLQYFTAGWNVFDFVLVIASIVGIVMEDMMENFPVSPTLLRVVRVFRIGRILRLIKAAKGIRKLLFALMVSLPALFNIGALLSLITFIYAIIGMTLFGHVKHAGALNDQVNFETFARAMLLLFRLVTSAGWNDVLDPLLVTPPDCDPDYRGLPNGNCGHPFVAIIYFVSFIIINFMIVINMYIAIILENFNQAHQEEEIGIVEEDLEMFYTKWAKYDPHATQFISFNVMSDFISSLDPPLGIPKPNLLALVSFDLPIAKGDKIHCLDVLHSLTKYTLGFVDDGSEDFGKLASQMDEKFKKQFPTRKELEIVSSTREWKKKDNAAKTIQRFFLKHIKGIDIDTRIDIHTQTLTNKTAMSGALTSIGAIGMPTGEPFSRRGSYNPPTQQYHHSTKPDEVKRIENHWSDEKDQSPMNERMLENGDYDPRRDEYDLTPDEKVTRALYQESDIDWKTHSLPSLGRASSENTLGSASGLADADCYAIRKSVSRTNKNKKTTGGNNRRAHSMIVTDEELEEEEDERGFPEEDMEDNFNAYDVADLPGIVPEQITDTNNQRQSNQDRRKDRKRNQSTSSRYQEFDCGKKYNQSQQRPKQGRGRGEKDKRQRGKRYSGETSQSNYCNQDMSTQGNRNNDGVDLTQMDNWDDTLYWGPENDNQEQSDIRERKTNIDNTGSRKSGSSQTRRIDLIQPTQYKEIEDSNIVTSYPPDNQRIYDASPGFARSGPSYNLRQDFAPGQRATLPVVPGPLRPTFDQQPIRLLPHCPIRQVITDRGGQAVVPRRKLPQIPSTKPSQPGIFGKIFRQSLNIESLQKPSDNTTPYVSTHYQSDPDINYLSLPRNMPPQQLTARQLPTAPVLGARRTFSFSQSVFGRDEDEGRRSPAQRFSYHDALRGGRASVVPFRSTTTSGNQVQFQDQYSSLPRERKMPRIERYNSLQGSQARNYSAPRAAAYDPRRLSFHEQGRPVQRPSSAFPNKRFSLRVDNRSPHPENLAALHVVGNKQGFHYPINSKSKRLSGQYQGKYDPSAGEPSPPPAVAILTPSENATEPDYDVCEAPQSVDDESMNSQDRYEQDSSAHTVSVFNQEEDYRFVQTLQDPESSGRQTSLRRDYKASDAYWKEDQDELARRANKETDGRLTSRGRGYKPEDIRWQEEDENARRERLRQNLQKQISEEATGTITTSLGNRMTKQGSCDYHGAQATSLELDYEYDEPEQHGFYHMQDAGGYEREYSQSYDTKNQGDVDIDMHLNKLEERQYEYEGQGGDPNVGIESGYIPVEHGNPTTEDFTPRVYDIDMRLQRATERTLAQELSEAYVEEEFVDDYHDEQGYPESQRRTATYQDNPPSPYYYGNESRVPRHPDDVQERTRYREGEQGYEDDPNAVIYGERGAENVQRYFEEDTQIYQEDECVQKYPRSAADPAYRGVRKRHDYVLPHDKVRGQKMSTTSNISMGRQMSDIVEQSSQVLSPSEEDQQYIESEDSHRLKPQSERRERELEKEEIHSPVSPRRRRRTTTEEYSDLEVQSSNKPKTKKDGQKVRSSKTTKHDSETTPPRRHQKKEQSHPVAREEGENLPEEEHTKPHDKKNKGARPRKTGEPKPRKHHTDKKTEGEGSDPGISDSHPQSSQNASKKSTSSRHTSESKHSQKRHQSQTDEQEGHGGESHRQRRQRQSIRRQRPVETNPTAPETTHTSRHGSSTRTGEVCEDMVEDDGDCFGSDEFNYDRDGQSGNTGNRSSGNNMKYMDDRSNCRKK